MAAMLLLHQKCTQDIYEITFTCELHIAHSLQGISVRPFPGLVNSVPAVASLFCLNLPAAFLATWERPYRDSLYGERATATERVREGDGREKTPFLTEA